MNVFASSSFINLFFRVCQIRRIRYLCSRYLSWPCSSTDRIDVS
ncbi:hypothetical protein M114_4488 [Bacteroides fragilis str. 3986 N(B)22]|nr:hypothetical protein M114_4399 [Bacteroides fragilis str. 3986 N(B)22]EYA54811.1 hypothetical protein M114_4500 [Bacteroides fragilis str. 3986 N(B)22]EYA54822.1 hypothetical protein M114_4488 [Bacteroides fragilis str. 3986 N(B)22]